jgi:hypothetical protein
LQRRPFCERLASDPIGNVAPPPPWVPYAPGTVARYVVAAPREVGNGFAVAALTLGIVGVVVAPSPFGFFVGGTCGLLGFVFGLLGLRSVTTRGGPLTRPPPAPLGTFPQVRDEFSSGRGSERSTAFVSLEGASRASA